MTNVEVVEFEPCELVTCDELLLADAMFKEYCDFMIDRDLDNTEPLIKPDEVDVDNNSALKTAPSLSTCKQLVLTRACLSDVIYAIHFLGLWCAKKTVKLYLTEFSRLLHNDPPAGDIIAATSTVLYCIYGRLDGLTAQFKNLHDSKDTLLKGATPQLNTLLHYIRDFKTPPNSPWPICIIHVRKKIIAKVMALWLEEISSENEDYSFIKPNYIVGSSRKHRNRMAVDNFDVHHEASIREFRFGDCNTLVISTVNERCADMLRCNLVVSFDCPTQYTDFMQAKANCRHDSSKYVIMINKLFAADLKERIKSYINMDRSMNSNIRRETLEPDEIEQMKVMEPAYPPYPAQNSKNPANIWRGVSIINKYCTKLPSDSFTKLCPEWSIKEIEDANGGDYYCEVRLPINSPVRQTIVGPQAPTKNIAMRLAAFACCKVLHEAGELDDNMLPIKKESMKATTPWICTKEFVRPRARAIARGQSIGSTKHRQYYQKRIAEVFAGPLVDERTNCYLYKFKMVLTCPLPDEQNRRGRRIIDPSETNRNYAIVCTKKLPKICSFPVFTRSGEVLISVELILGDFKLNAVQIDYLRTFHKYTFSKVLRLEKYPTIYNPEESPFTVLLAPVIDVTEKETEIDWDFVDKIVKSDGDSQAPTEGERMSFEFNQEDYVDAVVIPWYRLTDRQQFAYYVAEICASMSPQSPFPDESSGFKTFVDYYTSKYKINIFNMDQPVLDVDHTSARLNLLTPRYVNRKGRTLPSSTAKTRRESRESLIQKQLLIPELCTIHPFPASFWRKAVCLPCIFYRLNSLFLAEELRREVAMDIKVGFVEPSANFNWPPLDFGWSLKDVINGYSGEDECEQNFSKSTNTKRDKDVAKKHKSTVKPQITPQPNIESACGEEDFIIDHFDPSKYEIPDIPLDAPPEEWMNIKLISSSNSGCDSKSGWDQPLEQQDLFLQHTNEITWSDCEMEFDGEITERPAGEMRCGSPSTFEPSFNNGLRFFSDSTYLPPQQARASAIANKTVKFQQPNLSDDSLDETKPFAKFKPQTLESDDSWSISDDDLNDCDDDGDNGCYGEWKDDKMKNQPLLRELFVPSTKKIRNSTVANNLDAPYGEEGEQQEKSNGTDLTSSSTVADCNVSNNTIKLETLFVRAKTDQPLVKVLNKIFEDKLNVCQEDIESDLKNWYDKMHMLDARVDSALCQNPDLFKDNGIELIAVDDSLGDYNLEMQPTFGELLPNRDVDCNWSSEEWKKIKFDPTRKEIKSEGPGPSVILQALTMSNASDGINLERLETVGDSFLKYSITAYLYCMYPTMHEGKLSYLRSTEISNANLYHLGRLKNLGEIMSATKFEPNDNWLAPGYLVVEKKNSKNGSESGSVNKKIEIDRALAEVPYDLQKQHSIPDKSIADCVEALIGAYLTASGSRAALLFMQWLGLRVIPPSYDLDSDLKQGSKPEDEIWRWLDIPKSPLICTPPSYSENAPANLYKPSAEELKAAAIQELDLLYKANNMKKFEEEIQYSFKDKAYLVQAFTHNSFHKNHVTDCHQRLEFLGDALLDYLITRYLFEDPRCHSPGTLTDLRSALVNNTFFASLAVKYKFHEYLKYISKELYHVIDGFVKKFRFDSKNTITKGYTLLISEGESEYAEDIEVPKALGDVFESVAGAIYLDSGMSLDQVWQVYFKMMEPEIEYFSSHVPKSPIRELLESMPQNVRFSPSELAPDRKHRVTAEVFGLGRFTGVGRNKHSAKSTAAKRALRMLALKRKKELADEERAKERGIEIETE